MAADGSTLPLYSCSRWRKVYEKPWLHFCVCFIFSVYPTFWQADEPSCVLPPLSSRKLRPYSSSIPKLQQSRSSPQSSSRNLGTSLLWVNKCLCNHSVTSSALPSQPHFGWGSNLSLQVVTKQREIDRAFLYPEGTHCSLVCRECNSHMTIYSCKRVRNHNLYQAAMSSVEVLGFIVKGREK